MQQIAIDSEFKSLIPPLADDERAQLEANLLAEGCRDALVCWRQGDTLTLVDGHNRHELCTKHALPYSIVERSFDSREDAIIWIVNNQLARRNITDYTKVKLALRMKDAIAAKAKANQIRKPADFVRQNSDEQIRTDDVVAAAADVSRDTVRKVEEIEKEAPEPIKKKAAAGELSINRASKLTKALKGAPEPVKAVVEKCNVDDAETVNILKRLAKNGSETLDEIVASGYIQPGDEHEAVHISDGALAVQAALNLKAKVHKQLAADEKTERKTAAVEIENPYRVFCADIRNQPAEIEPESVDFIITDPPYPVEFIPLYGDLAQYAARVLKPGGSLLIMSGQMYKPQLYALVTPHLTYHWELAYLTPGGQSPQIWPRSVNTFWKPILWFVKGEYKGDWIGDVVSSEVNDNDKRFHKWGQSLSGIDELILKFTYPGQTILDPFLGGGTVAVSAVTANRRFVGFDIEQSAVNTTTERLQKLMEKSA